MSEFVTMEQADAFLATYLFSSPLDLALIGEGAWCALLRLSPRRRGLCHPFRQSPGRL
ncbi:MAG: hypothetical protein R2854_14920 [Caldilineaceae bacterium]